MTERDVVKIIGSTELFSPQVPIRPFMSSPLVTGSSATTLSKAIEIMSKKNIRRLPITDKDSIREETARYRYGKRYHKFNCKSKQKLIAEEMKLL